MREIRERKRIDEWLEPRNLFVAGAALWGAYGSYIGFQKDTTVTVSVMQSQIADLKERNGRNEADIRELRGKLDGRR